MATRRQDATVLAQQRVLLLGLPASRPPLGARLVAMAHEHLHGCCEALGGRRSAPYLRQMLRREHPITLDDVAEWAEHRAREPRETVRALALELLAAVEPPPADSVHLAAARYASESSDVAPAVLRAVSDGAVTAAEAAEISREVVEADTAQRALMATLARIA